MAAPWGIIKAWQESLNDLDSCLLFSWLLWLTSTSPVSLVFCLHMEEVIWNAFSSLGRYAASTDASYLGCLVALQETFQGIPAASDPHHHVSPSKHLRKACYEIELWFRNNYNIRSSLCTKRLLKAPYISTTLDHPALSIPQTNSTLLEYAVPAGWSSSQFLKANRHFQL